MAVDLPINRDVTISEKRNYTLKYNLCPKSLLPSGPINSYTGFYAKAFPKMSVSMSRICFLGQDATSPVFKTFQPGEKLWRYAGFKQGKWPSQYEADKDYSVFTQFSDLNAPWLTCALAGSTLSVTIPFGATFSRYVYPYGAMSDEDTLLENDPMRYNYAVLAGTTIVGQGTIYITIDLGRPIVPPPTFSVCSSEAT